MNHLIGKPQTVLLQIGDNQFTGKRVHITDMSIRSYQPSFNYAPEPITVELTMKVLDQDWFAQVLNGTNSSSVKDKLVDDCSAAELLFAARKKLEEQ